VFFKSIEDLNRAKSLSGMVGEIMSKRKVQRVLVMLDYGPEDSDSGEVFDLTALVTEMLPQSVYSASLTVEVSASKTYAGPDKPAMQLQVSFGGYAGQFVHGSTHLDDVVNSALPDGERVSALKKKAKRLRKKAEDVDRDAMVAKLTQVSEIRHQHPIARVNTTDPQKLIA
jgi:hypothetical protein